MNNFSGKVSLFLGIESYGWNTDNFQPVISFAKKHSVDSLLIKAFDGPSMWYGDNFPNIHRFVTASGIKVIPYGYCYGYGRGSDLQQELNNVEYLMNEYGICCMNIESEWDGNPSLNGRSWASRVSDRLSANPNQLWVSCLANPVEHNQEQTIIDMLPAVDVWMPEVYSNYYERIWRDEFAPLGMERLYPTFHLTNEFGANDVLISAENSSYLPNVSFWEYQYAVEQYGLFDNLVSLLKGAKATVSLSLFPIVGQMTTVTTDLQDSENAEFNCVAASLGACMLYFRGLTGWNSEINPDRLKDAAYGQGYTGGTAASYYQQICDELGFTLVHTDGTNSHLVTEMHVLIKNGIPVVFTEPDPYVPASYGWSHVCIACGEQGAGFSVMDPYPPMLTSMSDIWAVNNLQYGQIWYLMPKGAGMMLELVDPMVAKYFTAGENGRWNLIKGTDYRDDKPIAMLGAILSYYRRIGAGEVGYNGLTILGLPTTNEIYFDGIVKQEFERGHVYYDLARKKDNPPGAGSVYHVHIDTLVQEHLRLQAEVAALKDRFLSLQRAFDLQTAELEDTNAQLAALTPEVIKNDMEALAIVLPGFQAALAKVFADAQLQLPGG